MQFAEAPEGEGGEFEDDQFDDDATAALERLDSGEGWETVVEDLFGQD